MPKFIHTIETEYSPSFRSENVAGMFDVPVEKKMTKTWNVDIPIDDCDWSIGMIVGPSGSGKTTIARRAFPDANLFDGSHHSDWPKDKCLLDGFDKKLKVKEITGALSQVGFSSPPAWLLPFDKLSNGQKFRAEMARLILETDDDKIAMVDEFTSVVDRDVAKICSAAVQKMVRRSGKKMIAVSCHYDIAEWLEPDWIYHVDTEEFKRGRLRRPKIKLNLQRVHHSAWELFKGHHYLDAKINKAAHCFVASIDKKPVAFAAALPFPHPTMKDMWKGHRTVVLPDYQGVGIGNAVSEAVAQHYVDMGKRYSSVTSHPAMIAHRSKSKRWVMTRPPGRVPPSGKNAVMKKSTSAGRVTASFEFVGDKRD